MYYNIYIYRIEKKNYIFMNFVLHIYICVCKKKRKKGEEITKIVRLDSSKNVL